jgi:hypothetical protein
VKRTLVLSAALLAAACGDEERDLGAAKDAGTDVSSSDSAPPDAPPADGPAPKRTIIQRNPFGNVGASDNLLWDGDFEWHSAFASQYGWVDALGVIATGGFSGVRVGPDCRSGMKCGFLTQSQRVAAIGVSPSNALVEASIWSKPSTGLCEDVRVLLIACDYGVDPDLPVMDADGTPDAAGWCEHHLIAEPRTRASCLFVEALFVEGEAVIDDAIVRAAPPGSSPSMAAFAPTAEQSQAADDTRARLREWLKPGRAVEPEARRAFERFRRRPR